MKAFYRRAIAYKNFGQYKESLADLNEILTIEPENKDALKEHQAVKALFEKDLLKNFEKQKKAKENEDKKSNEAKVTPKVAETKIASQPEFSKPKIQKIKDISGTPKKETPKASEPKKRAKIATETISKATEMASKEIGKDTIKIPNTSYGFEADVNSLKKDPEMLYSYISKLPPTTYSKIYKNIDIQADYLMLIFNTLSTYESDSDKILNILYHFSQAQNITMTMMFMDDTDRQVIEQLIEKAKGSTLENKDKLLEKIQNMIN